MKTTYNKLVRDKIPQIIEKSGRKQKSRKMDDEEYLDALINKVVEEIEEYRESQNEQELADIYEVLDCIVKFKDLEQMHIDYLQIKKKESGGSFTGRILLEEVEED